MFLFLFLIFFYLSRKSNIISHILVTLFTVTVTCHIVLKDQEEVSQISYSLVVILELNSVPEVQYKDMMITVTDNEKYQQE